MSEHIRAVLEVPASVRPTDAAAQVANLSVLEDKVGREAAEALRKWAKVEAWSELPAPMYGRVVSALERKRQEGEA